MMEDEALQVIQKMNVKINGTEFTERWKLQREHSKRE